MILGFVLHRFEVYIKSESFLVLLHNSSSFLLRLFIPLISSENHGTHSLVIIVGPWASSSLNRVVLKHSANSSMLEYLFDRSEERISFFNSDNVLYLSILYCIVFLINDGFD